MTSNLQCNSCGATSWPYGVEGSACGWVIPCKGRIVNTAKVEESRQLSLEECVYWLVMTNEHRNSHTLELIVQNNAREVRAIARLRLVEARYAHKSFNEAQTVRVADFYAELWRNKTVRARLLLEVAKRIREAKR